MRIECTTTFLDDRERYERGDIFTISDDKAARFVANGWVKEVGAADLPPKAADPVTLDVQSKSHTQKAVTHG